MRALLDGGAARDVVLALVHVLQRAVGELAVLGEARHAEVHVPPCGVGVSAFDQGLDEVDDLADRLARPGLAVRAAQRESRRVLLVAARHLQCELLARLAGRARRVVDLVVHVGDVDHERHVVALVLEEALEQGEDDVGARIADVHRAVHGRTARVYPYARVVARLELAHLPAQRVADPDRAGHRGAIDTQPDAINDDGVIVGLYTDRTGLTHGYKAIPKDER